MRQWIRLNSAFSSSASSVALEKSTSHIDFLPRNGLTSCKTLGADYVIKRKKDQYNLNAIRLYSSQITLLALPPTSLNANGIFDKIDLFVFNCQCDILSS